MENNGDHGGNIWEFSRKFKCSPDEVLDFSSNLNDLCPLDINDIALDANSLKSYPDTNTEIYLGSLAKYAGVGSKNILLGPGLTYLIYRINQLFSGTEVAVVTPSFSEYRRSAIASNSRVINIEWLEDGDITGFINRLDRIGYDILFIARPSNPLGYFITDTDLERIVSFNDERGRYTFVDEAFIDFVPNRDPLFCRRMIEEYESVVFGRSLTKLFGLASLRLGYIISSTKTIERVEGIIEPWTLGQQALDLLSRTNFSTFAHLPEDTENERSLMLRKLTGMGFRLVSKPSANFFTLLPPPGLTTTLILDELARRRILAKKVNSLPDGSPALRFSVKSREKNETLLQSLEQILKNTKRENRDFNE